MRSALLFLLAKFRGLSSGRRTMLGLFAFCTGCLLVSWIAGPRIPNARPPMIGPSAVVLPVDSGPGGDLKAEWQRMKEAPKVIAPFAVPPASGGVGPVGDSSEYVTPMIAHAAELSVATKEFTRSRGTLEEILERHHGYVARLRMVGQPTGSLLTATVRVPASEFNGTVTDLKTLGSVEREEQSADEITQQRA